MAKRTKVELLINEIAARRLTEKPHFVELRGYDKNLIGVEMRKLCPDINKPFKVSFSVLEYSKLKMLQLNTFLKTRFGDKVSMLYIDTNSFFLQFVVDNLTKEVNACPKFMTPLYFSEISSGPIKILDALAINLTLEKSGISRTSAKPIR